MSDELIVTSENGTYTQMVVSKLKRRVQYTTTCQKKKSHVPLTCRYTVSDHAYARVQVLHHFPTSPSSR